MYNNERTAQVQAFVPLLRSHSYINDDIVAHTSYVGQLFIAHQECLVKH